MKVNWTATRPLCAPLAILVGFACLAGAAEDALMVLSQKAADAFRPPPLRSLGNSRKIFLKDYGLLPDTGKNAYPLFQKILSCLDNGPTPVEVILEPGKYRIHTPETNVCVLEINSRTNFILNGNGAQIIIENPQSGFIHLKSCSRAIIQNFSVDYDPLPFTQGHIIAVNRAEKYVDVRTEDGFPLPDAWYFARATNRFAGIRSRENPLCTKPLQRHTFPIKKFETLGPREYRYYSFSPDHLGNSAVGDPFWDIARLNSRQIVSALFCENISIINIQAFASPSVVFFGMLSERINVLDCGAHLKPGRYISVNADCIHFPLNIVGPWVENCAFEGCVDDVMNIYGMASHVVKLNDEHSLTVSGPAGPQPFMDKLKDTVFSIVDPETGTTKYRGRIIDLKRMSKTETFVQLDRPLNPAVIKCLPQSDAATSHDSELKWKADSAYFEGLMSAGFVVRSNTITHGHRFGIITPSRDGLIEHNLIQETGGAAIVVLNRMDEYPPQINYHARGGIVIRGNTVKDCNLSSTYATQNVPGAIDISFQNRFFQNTPAQELHDIVVVNNRVENFRTTGIFVSSADGVFLADNQIVCSSPNIPLYPVPQKFPDQLHAAIAVTNCLHVTRPQNRIEDVRPIDR